MKTLSKMIKRIIFLCLILLAIFCGVTTYRGYSLYEEALSEVSIEDKILKIKSDENYVTIDEVPEDYLKAVISIEDHRFYSHNGIDIISLLRAVATNISNMSLTEGGSTITQQLAKNMYFSQEKKLTRKVAEFFVTLDLENEYSKDEILELYINVAYFGDGYYGVEEASIGYFNKEPKNMTLNESTLLAGIPNAPSIYALSNNSKLTYQRQIQVIDAMVEYDNLDSEKADELKEEINEKINELL